MVEALNRKVPSLPLSPWTIFGLTDRSGEKGATTDHLATQLIESVSQWANVNMLLVDKMPIAWPANMQAYLDINNPIFSPVLHCAESKGSQHRPEFTLSLNRWLGIPEEQLAHLLETGQCLHNISLLIDDVMDNTTVRRGRETAHLLFGASQTLGAAHTALFQLLLSVYIQLGERCMIASLEEIARAYHGQASEVYFRDSYICPSEEEYLDIVSNKTGCGFRAIVRSLLALSPLTIPPDVAKLLVDVSSDVGCFFQIRDDYLDLVSE
jgi:geranylgeranyl diphosphate synthase type 3